MPKESDKARITTKTGTLLIRVIDDADGTPVSRNMTSANLATEVGGGGGGALLASNNLSDVANVATARTNLGVAIGSDVQAHSAVLDATTASFLTADETKLDGIEALADVTDATNVAAAGAHMAGGTDVPVADGGTGASTASAARTNLELIIGTHVQAHDADLATIAAQTNTAYGMALLELADQAALQAAVGTAPGGGNAAVTLAEDPIVTNGTTHTSGAVVNITATTYRLEFEADMNWATAAGLLIGNWHSTTTAEQQHRLDLEAGGILRYRYRHSTGSLGNFVNDAAVSFGDVRGFVRFRRSGSSGFFEESSDGTTWSQVGTTVSLGANTPDSVSKASGIGGTSNDASLLPAGVDIYSASIIDNGTTVVSFGNPLTLTDTEANRTVRVEGTDVVFPAGNTVPNWWGVHAEHADGLTLDISAVTATVPSPGLTISQGQTLYVELVATNTVMVNGGT